MKFCGLGIVQLERFVTVASFVFVFSCLVAFPFWNTECFPPFCEAFDNMVECVYIA